MPQTAVRRAFPLCALSGHAASAVGESRKEVQLLCPQAAFVKDGKHHFAHGVVNQRVGDSVAGGRGLCSDGTVSRETDGVIRCGGLLLFDRGGGGLLRLLVQQLPLCAVDAGHGIVVGDDILAVAVLVELCAAGLAVALKDDRLRGALDDLDGGQGLMVASLLVKVDVADFKLFHGEYLRNIINVVLRTSFLQVYYRSYLRVRQQL